MSLILYFIDILKVFGKVYLSINFMIYSKKVLAGANNHHMRLELKGQ